MIATPTTTLSSDSSIGDQRVMNPLTFTRTSSARSPSTTTTTPIITIGRMYMALKSTRRPISAGTFSPLPTIATIAAKYGNAVGRSTAVIPAPSASAEPGFIATSGILVSSRRCANTQAANPIATAPAMMSAALKTVLSGRLVAVRISSDGPSVRTRPPRR